MDPEELKETIDHLNSKVETLEKKLELLTKFITNRDTDFEPTYYDTNMTYSLQEYLDTLMFKDHDLDEIITFDLLHFIKCLLKKYKGLPIHRDKKHIKIYYQNKWIDFNPDHSKEILQFIHKKIISLFSKWKAENNETLFEKNIDIPLYIQKIFLLNENTYKKLHDYLKKDFISNNQ